METRKDVKFQDLPSPLDTFCKRLRAARIRFKATATDFGITVAVVHLKQMPRALAIWLCTRREVASCEA